MKHPERVTAIVTQNGNAYVEGLSKECTKLCTRRREAGGIELASPLDRAIRARIDDERRRCQDTGPWHQRSGEDARLLGRHHSTGGRLSEVMQRHGWGSHLGGHKSCVRYARPSPEESASRRSTAAEKARERTAGSKARLECACRFPATSASPLVMLSVQALRSPSSTDTRLRRRCTPRRARSRSRPASRWLDITPERALRRSPDRSRLRPDLCGSP